MQKRFGERKQGARHIRSCHADPPGAGWQLSLGNDRGEREKWGN